MSRDFSIESYIADLKVDNADDLLNLEILTKAYENTIFPLISLANIQGFSSNWVYQNLVDNKTS